jgi:hypothetical protein
MGSRASTSSGSAMVMTPVAVMPDALATSAMVNLPVQRGGAEAG